MACSTNRSSPPGRKKRSRSLLASSAPPSGWPVMAEPLPLEKGEPAIEVDDARFRYSASGPEVLHGVSLRVAKGEYLAMIGQNGGGKTTLAKLFNGLLKPTSGNVRTAGINTRDATVAELART